ncbi:hypothetical protein M885DRAFT_621539 [Pelagophyceae sp. CCMP2097]|nr:hypothetical protein M885DRAFT_621539 [Pelagophyceae sp. CCMP2097]
MALLARAAAVLAYAGGAHARTKVANLTDGMLHEAVAAWIADQSAAATVYGPIENWDTSKVTNMADVFASRTTFDGDVSKWDTSAVTNMRAAFYGAAAFNQNLSAWDVSQVLDLTFFVNGATAFATPLKWCLPEDANPRFAFYGCACCDDQCGVTQSDTCPGEPTSMPTPFPTVRPTPSPTVSPTEMPTPRPTRFVPPTMPKTKKKKKTNVVVYVIIASAVAGLCLGVCCCALLFRRRGKDYEEHQQRYAPEEDLFATVLRGGSWRKPLPGNAEPLAVSELAAFYG